ncbi:MAG: hypothetical protein ACREB9_05510 [Thermoplasmata archaeon]
MTATTTPTATQIHGNEVEDVLVGVRATATVRSEVPDASWFVNSTGVTTSLQLANGTYTHTIMAPGYHTVAETDAFMTTGASANPATATTITMAVSDAEPQLLLVTLT